MPTPRLVRQPRRAAVALAALLLASSAAQAQQPADIVTPRVAVERYTLPNGLTVLLSEDRSAPVVAVDIWYHVGSKNERPGRTGFAHLFEHVMFQGSEHVGDDQHLKIIEEAGGNINGSTNTDRTNYYDVVPSSELETALWLEADRMGWLLPVLTQAKLDNQRDVVKNERRQRYENQPYGVEPEVTMANIYPSGHPYSWTTIGSMADLSAASLDDVKEFFRTYYAPNNATLAIVGDFDPARAKGWVEKYFGGIPRGPAVTRPTVPTTLLVTNKRIVLEDAKARQPQITFAWPTVGQDNPDALALQGLAATLTRDRTSRLRKLLVYDRQLATNVNAFAGSDENAGEFYIYVTPRPNVSLTLIETLVDSVVASVIASPPTDREATRTRNYAIVGAITGLQSVLNKAEVLLEGQVFFGDPQRFTKELDDYRALTAADIHRVAQKYLTGGHLVLSMVPAGKLDMIARPELPYTNVTPAAAPAATSTK